MRTFSSVGLTLASCILFFVACSSSDNKATNGPDGGPGGSSSGKPGSSSGSTSGGTSSGGDVDGGGDAGLVPVGDGSIGAGCNQDSECNSKVCGVAHKCVLFPSCRPSNGSAPGIDSCGAAEPGNDSCCTSLTLPKTTTRTLDKYEITAGRMRAFMAALPDGNVRKWVKDYAAAHPDSQLGKLQKDFPAANGYSAYVDLFPDHTGDKSDNTILTLWLGAFPEDAINRFDGCYLNADGYGASTYWQDPTLLKPFGIGKAGDGKRPVTQAQADEKPLNCAPAAMLAAFCAWDGGELAEPSDYWEIWRHDQQTISPTLKFTPPWATIVPYGEFNWGNGHIVTCNGYPGCTDGVANVFYSFPKGIDPAVDDAPQIGAPGRFPKDVTKATSPDGNVGWYDVGGNLLEAAWPKVQSALYPVAPATTTQDYCDTANPYDDTTPAAMRCSRDFPATADNPAETRPGTLRFKGQPPVVALIGASFEVHFGYSEPYFANATDDETKIKGYAVPLHFQYGKVGGRCARTK
jgi:hypothetical protein